MTTDDTRYFISVVGSRRMMVYKYMNLLWKGMIYLSDPKQEGVVGATKPITTGAWDTSEGVIINELVPIFGTLREVTREEFEASKPKKDAS